MIKTIYQHHYVTGSREYKSIYLSGNGRAELMRAAQEYIDNGWKIIKEPDGGWKTNKKRVWYTIVLVTKKEK